jgi:hypothetical protein
LELTSIACKTKQAEIKSLLKGKIMTTINWTVSSLERDVATGYVNVAHWTCSGVDATLEGEFTGSVYATASFEGELVVPYASLTEADVLAWVWSVVDKEATEAAVAAQIEAQKNPVTASGTPWSN